MITALTSECESRALQWVIQQERDGSESSKDLNEESPARSGPRAARFHRKRSEPWVSRIL
jgi:hypothetical protein